MNTSIPSWLDSDPITSTQQPEPPHLPNPTGTTTATAITKYPRTAQELSLLELTYENLFESAIDRLALGHPLLDIVHDDPRDVDAAQFLKWIKKDKVRKERYYEAQELAAEFLVYAAIKASTGEHSMNDVKRDGLIVDTSLKVAGMWAPKRYGKEAAGPVSAGGGGGIVINIGEVVSPYAKDVTPEVPMVEITDVEVKE